MSSKVQSSNHTPLNLEKIVRSLSTVHFGTMVSKSRIDIPKIDKYSLILTASVLSFFAGLSFWIYVNFFLK